MNKKRKHILLKNEIKMIQSVLEGKVYPTDECISGLINRLEELKKAWYKVKKKKVENED